MSYRPALHRTFLGRDVMAAFAVLTALYLASAVTVRALQIPAYLLVVGYDLLEMTIPALTPYYVVGFPLYLYGLAVIGAGIARRLKPASGDGALRAVGGVLLIAGVFSLGFGAMVGGPLVARTDNPTALAVSTAAGLVLLLGGWWLVRWRSPCTRAIIEMPLASNTERG